MTLPSLTNRLAARQPCPEQKPVMYQRWEDLLFLHWTMPAREIQASLPAGLWVDTHAGQAYVGLVPFFMRNIRPRCLPAVPLLSNFHELNVRTYVHDDRGVPGVWFYSLDCDQPVAVWAARTFFQLPYRQARMRSRRTAGGIDYACQRAGRKERAAYRYRPTPPFREAEPESLEFFLLERYFLYAARGQTLYRGQVEHAPYRFSAGEIAVADSVPALWNGRPLTGPPVHQCVAEAVNVRVYPLQKLTEAATKA